MKHDFSKLSTEKLKYAVVDYERCASVGEVSIGCRHIYCDNGCPLESSVGCSNMSYSERYNIFKTELERREAMEKEWKPKRGDLVNVWDSEDNRGERIFLAEIKGCTYPIIVVDVKDEDDFKDGSVFDKEVWEYMEPINKPEEKKYTIKEFSDMLLGMEE